MESLCQATRVKSILALKKLPSCLSAPVNLQPFQSSAEGLSVLKEPRPSVHTGNSRNMVMITEKESAAATR